MDLLEKRAAIIAEHQAMVKHDPSWKGTTLAERPIAFLYDGDVVVVGDDVGVVLDGLKKFVADSEELKGKAVFQNIFNAALAKTKKLLAAPPAEIRCSSQLWNCYLYGLNSVGIDVVLAEGEP